MYVLLLVLVPLGLQYWVLGGPGYQQQILNAQSYKIRVFSNNYSACTTYDFFGKKNLPVPKILRSPRNGFSLNANAEIHLEIVWPQI